MMRYFLFAVCVTMVFLSSAAQPDPNGFVLDWLTSGPWPSYQKNGFGQALDTDFLGGESKAAPYPGLKMKSVFLADWSKLVANVEMTNEWGFRNNTEYDATWKSVTFSSPIISLDRKYLPIDDHFAVYAFCYIVSPSAQKIKIRAGSDDDHKIFLNGKEIARHYGSQGVVPNNFIYSAELKRGLNRLLLKIVDRTGGFGFCLALSDRTDKPLKNVEILTDNPGRKYGADLYDNGIAAKITFEKYPLFDGSNILHCEIFSPDATELSCSVEGKIFPGKKCSVPFNLSAGNRSFLFQVRKKNQPIAEFSKEEVVYSKEKLQTENRLLKEKLQVLQKQPEKLYRIQEKLSSTLKQLQVRLRKAYADQEKRYQKEHDLAAAQAPSSTDLPLGKTVTQRTTLCLNGIWTATGKDGKSVPHLLPAFRSPSPYFKRWYWPFHLAKDKSVKVNPGYEKDSFPGFLWSGETVTYQTEFPASGQEEWIVFRCDEVFGDLKVFCNGKECGSYSGNIGWVEIPLKNLKKGKNILALQVKWNQYFPTRTTFGISGGLYLEYSNPVRVADIYVKTSWRKAELSTGTELENNSPSDKDIELHQYVVENGRIRLSLPVQKIRMKAGEKKQTQNHSLWANPKLWGIGGKYGNPDLYELVSDVYCNGKLTDRHFQTFGFREFWIAATDFYLNGKRIFLQGDTGASSRILKKNEILIDLLRRDNINIIRTHDGDCGEDAVIQHDRTGMLSYVQMYPCIYKDGNKKDRTPVSQWESTKEHQWNLENCKRFFRMFRNHPSVVVWSTDNEIVTQASDSAELASLNERNERIAVKYEHFLRSLDPELIVTRNGARASWNRFQRYVEDPLPQVANYHYPEYNRNQWVVNWPKAFEYRPVIYGETLYCAWHGGNSPTPSAIAKRVRTLEEILPLYQQEEIPAAIYMGLSLEAFTRTDSTGTGNPWGVTAEQNEIARQDPSQNPPSVPFGNWPWLRIPWPALSGRGYKPIAHYAHLTQFGMHSINYFDSSRPSHVRSKINDAYQKILRKQIPLRSGSDAECIIHTEPFAIVRADSPVGRSYSVKADPNGKAWFHLPYPGEYTFSCGDKKKIINLPSRRGFALKPGFADIPNYNLN